MFATRKLITSSASSASRGVVVMSRPLRNYHRLATASSSPGALSRRLPTQRASMNSQRRRFHDESQWLEPEFSPSEDIMLDVTAWFVAFALCWSPSHDFDDLDFQANQELQEEASHHHQHRHSSTKKDLPNKKNRKQQQQELQHENDVSSDEDHHGKH